MTEKTYVTKEVSFDAAVLIYLENLADEEGCTLSDIINKLGRQRAMDEFKTVVNVPTIDFGRVPYRPIDDIRTKIGTVTINDPIPNSSTADYDMANGYEVTHSRDSGFIFCSPPYKPRRKGVGIR